MIEDKDFESICNPYIQYSQLECEMWENKSDCEYQAQKMYEEAITNFSNKVLSYYKT
jgi:hypothetical protein